MIPLIMFGADVIARAGGLRRSPAPANRESQASCALATLCPCHSSMVLLRCCFWRLVEQASPEAGAAKELQTSATHRALEASRLQPSFHRRPPPIRKSVSNFRSCPTASREYVRQQRCEQSRRPCASGSQSTGVLGGTFLPAWVEVEGKRQAARQIPPTAYVSLELELVFRIVGWSPQLAARHVTLILLLIQRRRQHISSQVAT